MKEQLHTAMKNATIEMRKQEQDNESFKAEKKAKEIMEYLSKNKFISSTQREPIYIALRGILGEGFYDMNTETKWQPIKYALILTKEDRLVLFFSENAILNIHGLDVSDKEFNIARPATNAEIEQWKKETEI